MVFIKIIRVVLNFNFNFIGNKLFEVLELLIYLFSQN
jgi:hypothetical protein